jgi:hypothetical protein
VNPGVVGTDDPGISVVVKYSSGGGGGILLFTGVDGAEVSSVACVDGNSSGCTVVVMGIEVVAAVGVVGLLVVGGSVLVVLSLTSVVWKGSFVVSSSVEGGWEVVSWFYLFNQVW